VAVRTKPQVCGRSIAGNARSNPAEDMDVRVVRCVGRGLCDLSRRALRSPFRVWHSAELCG